MADDAPGVRSALARDLTRPGLEILTAGGVEEALEILDGSPVDVLVADQGLEGWRGVELLEQVRTRHPAVTRVLLTGREDFAALQEAVNRSGVAFCLRKPWDRQALTEFIEPLLEERAEAGLAPAARHPAPGGPSWDEAVEEVPLPMALVDARGRVLRANRAARALPGLGLRGGEERDRCCEGADLPPDAPCPLDEALRSGEPSVCQRAGLQGLTDRVTEVASYPLTAAGPARAAVQTYRDLTEQRDLQDRLIRTHQLQAAAKLAAGVAHEIRNPLAAMMNAVSLLRSSAERGSEERDLIEIILDESRRMSRIVGDFLSFARPLPREGREASAARVDELIGTTVTLFEKDPRFSEAVDLRVDVEERLRPVRADGDRIREVLWNLLLNAAQAVAGGGRVRLSAREHSRDGRPGVCIAVEDSGPGIPPPMRERVFAPFETTKPNGTGLGLALARHIVESHGGAIGIGESDLGGARVSFWLASE